MDQKLLLALTLTVLAACSGSDPGMDASIVNDDGSTPMTDAPVGTDSGPTADCIQHTECDDGDPCTRDRCLYVMPPSDRSTCHNDLTPGACAEYRLVAGSIPYGCGVDTGGAVYCWDSASDETFWPRTPVSGIPPLTRLEISEGNVDLGPWDSEGNWRVSGVYGNWACGLDDTGSVWCWQVPTIAACSALTVPVHVQGISGVRELGVTQNGDGHLVVYMVDATGHLHHALVDFNCDYAPMAIAIPLTDPTLTIRQIDLWASQNRGGLTYYDGFAITEDDRLAGFNEFGVYEAVVSTVPLPTFTHIEAGDWTYHDPYGADHVFVALAADGTFWRQSVWALAVDSTSTVFERIEHAGFTTCGQRSDGTLTCFGGSNPYTVPYDDLHFYETPEESSVEIVGVTNPTDFSVVSGQLCVADEGRIRCWGVAEEFAEYPMPWNL
jgi:hypothetical protein